MIQFHPPFYASGTESTSGSFVITVDAQNNEICSFKWKEYKEITDVGKEKLHFKNMVGLDSVSWHLRCAPSLERPKLDRVLTHVGKKG